MLEDEEVDPTKSIEEVKRAHDAVMKEYMKLFKPREKNVIMQASQIFKNSVMSVEGASVIPLEHMPSVLNSKYTYEYRGKRIKQRVRIKW